MRTPADVQIYAPEFPKELPWLNVAFLRMDRLIGRSVTLIEFWDFARINSLRTMPYLKGWHERYRDAGLRVIGIHSPGYSISRDPDNVAAAVERLEIEYPVAVDSDLDMWRIYGNKGWPGRYLFDRKGLLRDIHYGEGAYQDTELVIQELLREIDPDQSFPDPLEPLRPEDAAGVLMEPQSADIALPADRARVELVRDWRAGDDFLEAADAGAAASVNFVGGGAWAVLSGADVDPGVYEMVDGRIEAESPGLRLHGVQFTPGLA